MASIEITIRTTNGMSITVNGEVADESIAPIANQLSSLLHETATIPVTEPTPAPAASA